MSKISFAVVAHNTEQHGLVLRYPSKNRIFPAWGNLPPVWEPLVYMESGRSSREKRLKIRFSYCIVCMWRTKSNNDP